MKSLALLLVGSLAANAVLVGALVVRSPNRTSGGSASSDGALARSPASAIAVEPNSAHGHGGAATATADSGPPVPRRQIWAALNTADLETYVANLRAAGFPEKTVRTLVSIALREQQAERREALESSIEDVPYWRMQSWWGPAPKAQAELRKLWREHNETLTQLLGTEANEESERMRASRERRYGNIPREKIEQINRVEEDYRELTNEIRWAARDYLLPEEHEKLAYLEKEKLADLRAILTPEEFLQHELRNSSTANMLRNEFRHLEISEEEFRALYALRAPFTEQFDSRSGGTRDPQQAETRAQAEKQMREQYRTVLGQERYEEYLRLREWDYQQLRRISERLELPKETVVRIHDLKKSTEQRANEIRRNGKLKLEEQNAQLSALAAEVKSTVSTALGTRGYGAYLEQAPATGCATSSRPSRDPRARRSNGRAAVIPMPELFKRRERGGREESNNPSAHSASSAFKSDPSVATTMLVSAFERSAPSSLRFQLCELSALAGPRPRSISTRIPSHEIDSPPPHRVSRRESRVRLRLVDWPLRSIG